MLLVLHSVKCDLHASCNAHRTLDKVATLWFYQLPTQDPSMFLVLTIVEPPTNAMSYAFRTLGKAHWT